MTEQAKNQTKMIGPWPTQTEWARLDNQSGIVMQTGTAVLVAAVAFAVNAPWPRLAALIFVGATAFVAVLLAIAALGTAPQSSEINQVHNNKDWIARCSLVALFISVEIGIPITVALLVIE